MYTWQQIEDQQERQKAAQAREREIRAEVERMKKEPLGQADAKSLKALNDELEALNEPERHPGHPMPRRGASYEVPGRKSPSGWGDAFVKAVKDLTPSGSVTVPALIGSLVRTPQRPASLLALVPFVRLVGTSTWWYLKETAYTNNAAAVAAGGKKPTSTYSVEKVEASVKTIAHLTQPIDRADLDDAASLSAYIDTVLREGVELALQDEILNGSGTAPHIRGIVNTVGIQTTAFGTDAITTARRVIAKLQTANIPLDGAAFVLSISDWADIELVRATTSGEFLLGSTLPVDTAARRLWGVPVVPSAAIDDNTGVLVDFAGSTQGVEREGVRIDWSEALYDADRFGTGDGGTLFEANQQVFRGEGRFDFAVTRPRGVCTFPTVGP